MWKEISLSKLVFNTQSCCWPNCNKPNWLKKFPSCFFLVPLTFPGVCFPHPDFFETCCYHQIQNELCILWKSKMPEFQNTFCVLYCQKICLFEFTFYIASKFCGIKVVLVFPLQFFLAGLHKTCLHSVFSSSLFYSSKCAKTSVNMPNDELPVFLSQHWLRYYQHLLSSSSRAVWLFDFHFFWRDCFVQVTPRSLSMNRADWMRSLLLNININFGLIMSLGMLGESSGVILIRLVISGNRSILLLVNS